MAAPAGSENRGSRPSSATSAGARGPAAAAVTTVLEDGDAAAGDAVLSADEAALAALGYRQEFRREFGPWSTFAVSFAVMGLLPSIASTMWYGIGYGACVLIFFFPLRSSPPSFLSWQASPCVRALLSSVLQGRLGKGATRSLMRRHAYMNGSN